MSLKSALLATVLLSASPALAADLYRAPPPAAAPAVMMAPTPIAFNWTGFYAGLHVGGGWNSSNWADPGGAPGAFNTDGNGFMLGGHVGYNWQYGQFVPGLEADIDIGSIGGSAACPAAFPGLNPVCRTDQTWLASLRGRIGYSFERFLVYATGGIAFTSYDARESAPVVQNWGLGARTGWVAGLGLDYAYDRNWVFGAEWKHYDFGSATMTTPNTPAAVKFSESENTLMLRATYRFDNTSLFGPNY